MSEQKTFLGVTGHLVTITSTGEQNALWDKFAGGNNPWIALTDRAIGGQYVWAAGPEKGQLTSFTSWTGGGEPNNAGSSNNMEYYVQLAGWIYRGWNDNNEAESWPYIVEYEGGVALDTTPPYVSSINPSFSQTGVGVGSNIVLTFSEAIQKGVGAVVIHSDSATGPVVQSYDVATSSNLSISGNTLTINPSSDLANNTHYYVTITAGSVKDVAGNGYSGTTSYDFTTVALADIIAPTVTSFSPSVGLTGVGISSDISLTFSEAIQRGSGSVSIHSGSSTGPVVAVDDAATSGNLSVSGNTLTIHHSDLANNTHYFVTLSDGSVKDVAGNFYAGTSAYDFTTVMPPDFTPATSSGNSTGVALAGVGVLGILAWVIL